VNAPAGLTELSVGKYAAASWLGMLPGTVAYVLLGSAGKETVVAAGAGNASVNLALYGATIPHEYGNTDNVHNHFVYVVLLGGVAVLNAAALIACHMHHLLLECPEERGAAMTFRVGRCSCGACNAGDREDCIGGHRRRDERVRSSCMHA
jgi:hypothetical protein